MSRVQVPPGRKYLCLGASGSIQDSERYQSAPSKGAAPCSMLDIRDFGACGPPFVHSWEKRGRHREMSIRMCAKSQNKLLRVHNRDLRLANPTAIQALIFWVRGKMDFLVSSQFPQSSKTLVAVGMIAATGALPLLVWTSDSA